MKKNKPMNANGAAAAAAAGAVNLDPCFLKLVRPFLRDNPEYISSQGEASKQQQFEAVSSKDDAPMKVEKTGAEQRQTSAHDGADVQKDSVGKLSDSGLDSMRSMKRASLSSQRDSICDTSASKLRKYRFLD